MKMKTFKLRAECRADAAAFFSACHSHIWAFHMEGGLFDVECTFSTDNIQAIEKRLAEIPDGHVMRETLAPIGQYTGQRCQRTP